MKTTITAAEKKLMTIIDSANGYAELAIYQEFGQCGIDTMESLRDRGLLESSGGLSPHVALTIAGRMAMKNA